MRPVVAIVAIAPLVLAACAHAEPVWPADMPAQPDCGAQRGCHVVDRWTDADGVARETFIVVETVARLPGMECGRAKVLVADGPQAVAVITLLPGTGPEVWRHEVLHTRRWTHADMPALIDRCGR